MHLLQEQKVFLWDHKVFLREKKILVLIWEALLGGLKNTVTGTCFPPY